MVFNSFTNAFRRIFSMGNSSPVAPTLPVADYSITAQQYIPETGILNSNPYRIQGEPIAFTQEPRNTPLPPSTPAYHFFQEGTPLYLTDYFVEFATYLSHIVDSEILSKPRKTRGDEKLLILRQSYKGRVKVFNEYLDSRYSIKPEEINDVSEYEHSIRQFVRNYK